MGMESESRVDSSRPAVFLGSDGVGGAGTFKVADNMAFVKFAVRDVRESPPARSGGNSVVFDVLVERGVVTKD